MLIYRLISYSAHPYHFDLYDNTLERCIIVKRAGQKYDQEEEEKQRVRKLG